MTKYYRKVVHLELENRNLCSLNNKQVAYYKIEDRNNRCKIMLSIEGILPLKTMWFCVITGEGNTYYLRKIKTINFSDDKVNDTYTLDQLSAEDIKGCLIMESQNEPFKKENVLLYAMHDIKISLENIQWNKLNDKDDIEQKVNDKALRNIQEAYFKGGLKQTDTIKQDIKIHTPSEAEDETEFYQGRNEDLKVKITENENSILTEEACDKNQQPTGHKSCETQGAPDTQGQGSQHVLDTQNMGDTQNTQSTQSTHNTQNTQNTQSTQSTQSTQNTQGIKNTLGTQSSEDDTKKNLNVNTLEYIKRQLESNEDMDLMHSLFEKNQEMKPFNHLEDRTEWVKIEITDLVFLPLESWLLYNNAFLMTCYRKYKHLILGRNQDEKLLKLGIPDIYFFKESLIANVCGFHEFFPCSGSSPKSGEYGYWIITTRL